MANTVQVHSDTPAGAHQTITLEQLGGDTGKIEIESTAAPDAPQRHALRRIRADLVSLKLTCQVDEFFSADIGVTIERATADGPPVATIVISHAIYGDGTYVYPLKAGEDGLMQDFLERARFPALPAGDV